MPLLSIGQIAEALGAPVYRIEYCILSRAIAPVGRMGRCRVFDEAGVEAIRAALETTSTRSGIACRPPASVTTDSAA